MVRGYRFEMDKEFFAEMTETLTYTYLQVQVNIISFHLKYTSNKRENLFGLAARFAELSG